MTLFQKIKQLIINYSYHDTTKYVDYAQFRRDLLRIIFEDLGLLEVKQ